MTTFYDIADLLLDQNIDSGTKTLSILYDRFPHIRNWLLESNFKFEFVDYRKSRTNEEKTTLMLLMGVHLLGHAYKDARQVHGRIKAAWATNRYDGQPTQAEVEDAITASGFKFGFYSGKVDAALGALLCMQADGTVDTDVSRSNMVTVETWFKDEVNVDKWGRTLFEQMRLAYTNYRQKALMTSFENLDAIKDMCAANKWTKEIEIVQQLKDKIKWSPYAGLVRNIPDGRNICNFPRVAYTAILYHQIHDEDKKAAPKKGGYDNLKHVTKHIKDKQDIKECQRIARQAPDPQIMAHVMLAEILNFTDVEITMSKCTQETRDKVMEMLANRDNPGAWCKHHLQMKKLEASFPKMYDEETSNELVKSMTELRQIGDEKVDQRIENLTKFAELCGREDQDLKWSSDRFEEMIRLLKVSVEIWHGVD